MIPPKIARFLYLYFFLLFILSCQKKATVIADSRNNEAESQKLMNTADRFYNFKQFDSAFFFYNKLKFICNPKTDAERYVIAINQMAKIQQNNGDFTGSELTVRSAIPYLKLIKNPKHSWNCYVILGNNYRNTYNYKSALYYYNKAYKLNITAPRTRDVHNKIACVYIQQKKYYEALQIFHSFTNNIEVRNNPEEYAQALDNIGYCYYKIDNLESKSYLENALKMRSEISGNKDIGMSYFHLALFYKIKNPALAKKYMLQSYQKFSSVKDADDRMLALKFLIENNSDRDLKKYSVLYVNLVDSMFIVRQTAKNQFAKINYDSKKEKTENLKLITHRAENELQLERQKNSNIISYIIIVISLSLIVILYFYLTSRGNKDKIEAAYKSETRIAKKLHDELANDIYHTMAFAENRNLALAENRMQLLNNLDAIYSRTRDISKENNPIITNEKYEFYLKEMISGFNTPDLNLILNGIDSVNWSKINRDKKIALYRVLQELLVNMKKHSNATLVGINFKTTDKNIIISYTDNGKGVNLNDITFKNGLHNIEHRILSIKGQIEIDSAPEKGFKVFFKLPI